MANDPPIVKVSEWELRAMFNDGNYVERALAGELAERVVENRHPTSPKADVPVCTESQEVIYLDAEGNEVAKAHRYLLADGTLGGRRPDPKKIYKNGRLYVAWTKRRQPKE